MLKDRIEAELDRLQEQNLERKVKELVFHDSCHGEDRDGQEYLILSSNNYLGLTYAPEVLEAVKNSLSQGTGSTGSRLVTGGLREAAELERKLARFKYCEDAMLFNTGYMTNLGVLYGLVDAGDIIFSDELNHASIIDGCRISKAKVVVYKHNDMRDLRDKLELYKSTDQQKFIVTDGVFSMDGDIVNLPELVHIKKQYDAFIIVDDAHSVGVLGADGAGTASHYGINSSEIDLQVGTLSKALASSGGYVAGNKIILDYLRNKSRPFIFSTFISPMDVAAANAALDLLVDQGAGMLARLRSNTLLVRTKLLEAGLPVIAGNTPIVPIMVGEAKVAVAMDQALREKKILLSAIRPPTVPQGESRLRLTVMATHEPEELRQAVDVIIQVWQSLVR